MSCHNCAQRTLGLFVRSIAGVESSFTSSCRTQTRARLLSTGRQPFKSDGTVSSPRKAAVDHTTKEDTANERSERLPWQIQKAAMKEKLGGEAWNPRKKLSPDTMEGIRHLHSTQPDKFTSSILASHFKVSPEAIRRILKSKWRPSDEEYEDRMQRWNKRGERIWTNLVEMGVKPPKKWREMGVGRATGGEKPKWKSNMRNMVHVHDSASNNFVVDDGDIIPIVDGSGKSRQPTSIPLAQRI
ncbi:required for respiratory growth protein 9, mitochondrial [Phaeosphaeria sp. MPI-PUGE-AT-0046c]|nr:required for respiratory growth protein 9, mitochondrial [Phaeosphaeria sp. MPI-PUGE-AT-0046c]